MPSTALKGLSVQTAGTNSGTWGAGGAGYDLNTGVMGVLDLNLAGVLSNSVSSSNITLESADTENCLLRFTGTLLANIVVSPDSGVLMNGFYYFENYTSGNFTITVTTGAGSAVLPQSRCGVMFVDTVNGPRIVAIAGKTHPDPVPVGTVMLFYQNAAPTGWTISSSLNDYALKIVSSAGGVTSGSVAYSTLFGRTTTDSHTLIVSEMPAHTHTVAALDANAGSGVGNGGGIGILETIPSSSVGGSGAHTHPLDMRVQTASIILASKN